MPKTVRTATIGIDLSAYTDVEVPQGVDISDPAQLAALAVDTAEHGTFEVNWDTSNALRVTSIREGRAKKIHPRNLCVQPSFYDGGVALETFLTDRTQGIDKLVDAAVAAKLIARPAHAVAYAGTVQFPGTEAIDIEFTAREGATQAELDLIFLQCLAQIATVNYLAVGNIPR